MRPRSTLVALVLVLGSIAAFAGSFAWWLDRQALSDSGWQTTSSQLIANPQIRRAVGTFAVDELFAQTGAAKTLHSVLPNVVADELIDRLRALGQRLADQILSSDTATRVWNTANRQAHRDLMRILDDRGQRGDVTLNLTPLLDDLIRQLQRSAPVKALPSGAPQLFSVSSPNAGEIRVLRADQVEKARTAVNTVRGLSVLLAVATVVLFSIAVAVAAGWRAVALRRVGYCLLVVGALVLVTRALIGPALADDLVSVSRYRPAARAAWTISTSELRDIAIGMLIVGGLFVALGLVGRLLGSGRRAQPA